MGCTSAIGLGTAMFTDKPVIVVDGDGAALMRLGALPMIAHEKPNNFLHILLDNNEHNSTGGQSTISAIMDWPGFAESIGYQAITVRTLKQLNHAIEEWHMNPKLTFIYMKINNAVKDKLGRPKVKPFQVSERFKNYINK